MQKPGRTLWALAGERDEGATQSRKLQLDHPLPAGKCLLLVEDSTYRLYDFMRA